jgi:hypothetical protein
MARWPLFLGVLVATVCCHAEDQLAKYAFTQPPLAIFDQLVGLKLGPAPALSDSERQFLDKVTRLRAANPAGQELAEEGLVLEAMLFASGSEDPARHGKYREQYERLVAAAKDAIAGKKTDSERGEKLLQFLHGGAMRKGYDLDITTLTAIFDEGKFNCVSSSALYYLVGSRLGLKLTLISIPGGPVLSGHASLDLIDGGRRLQVEPTNPDGFDWQAKLKRPGVVVLGYVPDRKAGREVDPLGLAATIYSNRGVALDRSKPPRRLEAARMYAAALALDPLTPTASHNLKSLFTNWGPGLAEDKRFEDGIRVQSLGRSLAPQDRDLQNNLTAVWSDYILFTLAADREQEALSLIGRAAEMLKSERDFASPSVWFIRRAQDRQKQSGWEAALASVESPIGLLAPPEAQKLREWRSGLFRRWSQEHLEHGDLDASAKVLARGLALQASNKEIHSGLGYHTIQALRKLEADGTEAMARHFQALIAQFPGVKDIADAGHAHASQQVRGLAGSGKFAEATAALERYKPLVVDPKHQADLSIVTCIQWGQALRKKKEWQGAIDKLAAGRRANPQDRRLENALAGVFDDWAKGFMDENKWDEAIRIYDLGLTEHLPGNSHLKGNKAYCEAKRAGK